MPLGGHVIRWSCHYGGHLGGDSLWGSLYFVREAQEVTATVGHGWKKETSEIPAERSLPTSYLCILTNNFELLTKLTPQDHR